MEHEINLGGRKLILEYDALEGHINIEELTVIDASNIFGESATVSASANRIGLLKAELEEEVAFIKLEEKEYITKFQEKLRLSAANNGGKYKIRVEKEEVEVKLTEKGLESSYVTDSGWKEIKTRLIKTESSLSSISSLEWSVRDKAKKLNGFMVNVTPEEFVGGLVEGKVNGMLLSKPKLKGSLGG